MTFVVCRLGFVVNGGGAGTSYVGDSRRAAPDGAALAGWAKLCRAYGAERPGRLFPTAAVRFRTPLEAATSGGTGLAAGAATVGGFIMARWPRKFPRSCGLRFKWAGDLRSLRSKSLRIEDPAIERRSNNLEVHSASTQISRRGNQ